MAHSFTSSCHSSSPTLLILFAACARIVHCAAGLAARHASQLADDVAGSRTVLTTCSTMEQACTGLPSTVAAGPPSGTTVTAWPAVWTCDKSGKTQFANSCTHMADALEAMRRAHVETYLPD